MDPIHRVPTSMSRTGGNIMHGKEQNPAKPALLVTGGWERKKRVGGWGEVGVSVMLLQGAIHPSLIVCTVSVDVKPHGTCYSLSSDRIDERGQ